MLKRLVKDSAIYGLGDFVFKVLGFAVFPIYARAFTVEEFGVMTLVGTVSSVVALFCDAGLHNALQRFYWDTATTDERRPVLVSTALWLLLSWTVLLTLLASAACLFFDDQMKSRYGITFVFLWLSLLSNIPSHAMQFAQNILRLNFSPWKFTILSAGRNCISVVISLLLVLHYKQGLAGYFYGTLWGLLVALPLGFWFIRNEFRLQIDRTMGKELLQFGYPFIFVGLGYWIFASVDRIMLAELSNNTEVGLYGIAQKFAFVMVFLNSAIGQAWSPLAIKIFADDKNYRHVFSRFFTHLFFGLVAVGAAICLFSRDVLHWMTPPAYWPAANTLCVLAMAQVLAGTTQITALGISLEKKTHLFTVTAWITGGISLLLNWIFIPYWGALGAAFASLISYAVLSGMYLYWSQRLHPLPLQVVRLFGAGISLVLTLFAAFFLNTLGSGAPVAMLSAKVGVCGALLLCAGIILRTRGGIGSVYAAHGPSQEHK
jgi:O-antigen/teichoic acid export membrane protein